MVSLFDILFYFLQKDWFVEKISLRCKGPMIPVRLVQGRFHHIWARPVVVEEKNNLFPMRRAFSTFPFAVDNQRLPPGLFHFQGQRTTVLFLLANWRDAWLPALKNGSGCCGVESFRIDEWSLRLLGSCSVWSEMRATGLSLDRSAFSLFADFFSLQLLRS